MGKNWAKTGAKAALLAAGLVVIGTGAANADPINAGNVTGALAPVTNAVGQLTGNAPALPAPLAKKHLDGPAPVLPGAPVQSSAVNTGPALAAVATAEDNLAEHTPGGKPLMDKVRDTASKAQHAAGDAPRPLAKKRGPVPGVGDKQVNIPPNVDNPGAVGTPLDQAGDPGAVIGGAVKSVTDAVGQSGLASQ